MRSFAVALALSCASALACLSVLHDAPEQPLVVNVGEDSEDALRMWPREVVPVAEPVAEAPLTLPHPSWCEPLYPIACDPTAPLCPVAPDGTPLRCVANWSGAEQHGAPAFVCAAAFPTRDVRAWRGDRLRVLVDEICQRRDGCDPAQLHAYLTTLAMRESTLRPWKLHRLAADRDANARAWQRYASRYADNPARGDADRWMVGRGYYGGNAAALLHVWDATAIPEALCGEVEATLVHLRTARRRWRQVAAGVTCNGELHTGTAINADGTATVSWYDVSLANSGSDPCPGVDGQRLRKREDFERRAQSRGLDPYAPISLASLGRDVPRDEQQRFASDVRRKMDAVTQQ